MPGIAALHACAQRHLHDYTDPGGRRAFATYDRQGDPAALEPVDCLAPALLSVPLGHRQVVPLFQPDGPGAGLLRAMQAVLDDEACATADFLDLALDDPAGPWALVDRALAASRDVAGVKAVAVTKILHRKRPRLVPIFDRSIHRFYTGLTPPTGAYQDTPRTLWPLLQNDLRRHRAWLTDLAAPVTTPDGRPLSPLRAADIVIWEHAATGCTAGPGGAATDTR
ncbi:DUF6308 family protein [Kitasatospora sp. A2-31]|uniref:DUF6308 family protein n=1 Tax=Kitasatospora sp. A2-31 TaxID=2916414 RepID=UPI001EEEFB21|nr:DUF6308 family protein [Kitasatospora sp. A2-31]MCG6499626.1 DUF6308 family protein [Kitasatospora sp. A2-31]